MLSSIAPFLMTPSKSELSILLAFLKIVPLIVQCSGSVVYPLIQDGREVEAFYQRGVIFSVQSMLKCRCYYPSE